MSVDGGCPAGEAEAHAALLAGLPGMTPVRLARLLDGFQPILACQAIRSGTHPADPQRRFRRAIHDADVEAVKEEYRSKEVEILLPDSVRYPAPLVGDPGAPAVLFGVGDPSSLEGRPRVAIVGTRSATPYGLQVASELASDLADEGVVIVSGLAKGIDGAAHSGVLGRNRQRRSPALGIDRGSDRMKDRFEIGAPPVAVVGTGLDVTYPIENADLWSRVRESGAIFSESPLGTPPHPRVFPARNRIIAALSDVVVVVECFARGGSLYTAEAAARRSIPVCAVPGSVKSRASNGTNALLVDGCIPIRDAGDVLAAVALARAGVVTVSCPMSDPEGAAHGTPARSSGRLAGSNRNSGAREAEGPTPAPELTSVAQHSIWEAVDDTPTVLEAILLRTGLSIAAAAQACDELVENGLLLSGAGWWSRR